MIFNLRAKEVLGVIESDSTKLEGSYASALKINKIGGVCEQGENTSPTNKQEVKPSVVSVVKTHWKNFLNPSGITNQLYSEDGVLTDNALFAMWNFVSIKKGDKVTISAKYKGVDSEYLRYALFDTNKKFISRSNSEPKAETCVINATQDGYIRVFVSNTNYDIATAQLEFGVATPFEPYTESSITFSQPIELYGIGDVQDTIEGGKVIRRCAVKRDLVFSATNSAYDVEDSSLFAAITTDGANKGLLLSNVIEYQKSQSVLNNNITGAYQLYGVIYARIQGVSDVDEFNSLIANNVFIYELAEPTTEVLKSKNQMSLNTLQTFDGVTYVEFDSEVQPTLNCDYATSPVGAVALSIYAYDEIIKHYVKYNDDGSVRFNGSVNVDDWVIANNVQAYQMVYADSIQTYKGIKATTDVTAQNNVVAQNELRGKDLHFTNMGVGGGVAQPVEWVWDAALARWVLCSVTG